MATPEVIYTRKSNARTMAIEAAKHANNILDNELVAEAVASLEALTVRDPANIEAMETLANYVATSRCGYFRTYEEHTQFNVRWSSAIRSARADYKVADAI